MGLDIELVHRDRDPEEDALEWARGYKAAVENRVGRYGYFHEPEPGQIERLGNTDPSLLNLSRLLSARLVGQVDGAR